MYTEVSLFSLNGFLAIFGTIALFFFISTSWHAFYNLCLHPLKKFPGPTAAALSGWWEIYHVIKCKKVRILSKWLDAKDTKVIDSMSFTSFTKNTDLWSELVRMSFPFRRLRLSTTSLLPSAAPSRSLTSTRVFNLELDLNMRACSIVPTTRLQWQKEEMCNRDSHQPC